MALLYAATIIGFTVLALVCLSVFGLFGIVVWLLIYGLFHLAANALRKHVTD